MKMLLNSFIAIFVSMAFYAFAGQEGGGGVWTEGDLKHFLNRLIPYINSEEGLAVFPEVKAYNETHPNEAFGTILAELNPRLVDGPVYDQDGNERDCVSGFDSVRFFKCNQKALPPRPDEKSSAQEKSEYYGSLYRLTLHEAFVQVGLEKRLTKEIVSDYTISSRLQVHLENYPEWVPGRKTSIKSDVPTQQRMFTLTGTPGTGQGNTFFVCEYQTRSNGTAILGTLQTTEQCLRGKLNEPLHVYPGNYLLSYGNVWRSFIEIRAENDLSLALTPYTTPLKPAGVSFSFFYDLTDNDEFGRAEISGMIQSSAIDFYKDIQPGSWTYTNMKPFFDTGDPQTITSEMRNAARNDLGQTCRVDQIGRRVNCWFDEVGVYSDKDRRYIPLKNGESISLLPGIYGIQWKFPDGHISYQRGIVIH